MNLTKSAFLFVCFIAVQQAWACDCKLPTSVKTSLQKSDAVFTGSVIKIEQEQDTSVDEHGDTIVLFGMVKTVTIQLDTDYKDTNTKEGSIVIIKTTSIGVATCGYNFETGKKYIVYANKDKKDGMLWTNMCTRTKQYQQEEADQLAKLSKK